jgi:hypothetical protein
MKPKLFFGLNLNFDITLNEQLKQMAAIRYWDVGLQKFIYIFPLDKLKEVSSLIKDIIIFEEEDITKLIYYTGQETKSVEIEKWKGESGFEVTEFPRIYQVVSYQKAKGSKPVRHIHNVSKETLLRVWNVFLQLQKDQLYDFPYISERICKEFNLERFFRPDSKTFDKQKFQGSRCPREYGTYYYFPLVVLEHLGLIKRNGRFSKRVKDNFEEQSKIKEMSGQD